MRPSLVFFLFASMISFGFGSQDELLLLEQWKWDRVADYLLFFVRSYFTHRMVTGGSDVFFYERLTCHSERSGPLNLTERAGPVTVISSEDEKKTEIIVTLKIPKFALAMFCYYNSTSNTTIIADVRSHSIVLNITVPLYRKELARSDRCKSNNVKMDLDLNNLKLVKGENSSFAFIRKVTPFYQGSHHGLMETIAGWYGKASEEAVRVGHLCSYLQHLVE